MPLSDCPAAVFAGCQTLLRRTPEPALRRVEIAGFMIRRHSGRVVVFCVLLAAGLAELSGSGAAAEEPGPELLAPQNLVAWCIVPFDAAQRTPEQRADMVRRLGLRRVAYDWRAKHVAEFEDEILQYQKHGLEFFAFWSWHDAIEPLLKKHDIHPQIWAMLPEPQAIEQSARVREAAEAMLPLVRRTASLGCRLGLYNHGRWGGEPDNMTLVCEYLREHHDADHVGIVYNFHHGHEHIDGFADHFAGMLPYLLCVNINGMADADTVRGGRDKILTLGAGRHEAAMLRVVLESGYSGPIGILDHRSDRDSEEVLKENLAGLAALRAQLATDE